MRIKEDLQDFLVAVVMPLAIMGTLTAVSVTYTQIIPVRSVTDFIKVTFVFSLIYGVLLYAYILIVEAKQEIKNIEEYFKKIEKRGIELMKRNLILLSFLLFITGSVLGFSLSSRYDVPEDIDLKSILELSEQEFNMDHVTFTYISINNLKAILLLSFGGALTFGGSTFLNLILNGINIGTLFYDSLIMEDVKTFFLLILPHGIFEIPALIIAGAAGFKIPYEVLRFALGKKEEIISEEDAKEFFKLVAISIVLIFIAALIESTITLKIAKSLG